jgi:hypothetical protein
MLTYNDDSDAVKKANAEELTRIFCEGNRVVTLEPGYQRLFIDRPFRTLPQSECGFIERKAGGGYSADGNPGMPGNIGAIWQTGRCPIGILSGAGFTVRDSVGFYGHNESAAFEVEGRNEGIATGFHSFESPVFHHVAQAFKTLPGFYEVGGGFHKDENHADNCIIRNPVTMDCGGFLLSLNQQSLNWVVGNPRFLADADNKTKRPFIAADLQCGGDFSFIRPIINHQYFTAFRVKEFSPNNCELVFDDFKRDRLMAPDNFFTLFDFAGKLVDAPWCRWKLRIRGKCATYEAPFRLDKLLKVPDTLPRDDWDIEVTGVPCGKWRA